MRKDTKTNDARTALHEKNSAAKVPTAKCPHGKKYLQQTVPRRKAIKAKCPYDKVSLRRSLLKALSLTTKRPTVNCPTA